MQLKIMKAKVETNDGRAKRKIIQIAVSPPMNEDGTDSLYALCDDGTLWFNYWDEGEFQAWERLKEIP